MCDLDGDLATDVAGWLRGVQPVTDLDEVLADDEIDVVDLCTPPHLHRAQVEAVLRAGKDVFCEKPLVGSVAEVDELAAIAAETGRTVMPILQYRFGHGIQKLRRVVDLGLAGQPYVANVDVAWLRGQDYYEVPWRGRWATELGGALLSHAVHALDMLLARHGSAVRGVRPDRHPGERHRGGGLARRSRSASRTGALAVMSVTPRLAGRDLPAPVQLRAPLGRVGHRAVRQRRRSRGSSPPPEATAASGSPRRSRGRSRSARTTPASSSATPRRGPPATRRPSPSATSVPCWRWSPRSTPRPAPAGRSSSRSPPDDPLLGGWQP